MLAIVLWATAVAAVAAPVPWQHASSPYRAEFDIKSQPSQPEAGVAVTVPVCGLGFADGSDLLAYDEHSVQLPLVALGESAENKALALVKAPADSKQVLVYFGAKMPAPQNKMVFLPGLTVDIRSFSPGPFSNWQEVEKLLTRSLRRGKLWVDKVELSYNPVTSEDAFLMVFEGFLRVPQAGPQTYMLISQDAGYLFIDGKLVIERNGPQSAHNATRGQSRATVNLTAGPHAVKCVVVAVSGEQMAILGRFGSDRDKSVLAPQDFLQPGKTQIMNVRSRIAEDPCPVFYCRPETYIGYAGFQFTEATCGTADNLPADWLFADGARYHGAQFRKVFVGLNSIEVKVKQKNTEARGEAEFPEQPPKRSSIGDYPDFKHYSELIMQENHERVDLSTLKGYRAFLAFKQLNPDMLSVCNAILKKPGLDDGTCREVSLDVARIASAKDPERAAQCYRNLFKERADEGKKPWWRDMTREYAEFAIFRLRDLTLAQTLADALGQAGNPDAKAAVLSLELDMQLQRNEVDKARQTLDGLLRLANEAGSQRLAAVKTNALRERFKDLMNSGFLVEARNALWEWERLAPENRLDGALPLERSRLWRTYGWLDGALIELDGAVLLNNLLPNLPEVEFERGVVCQQAGDLKKAREIFGRVAQQYPNHPLAAQARERLK